MTTLYNFHLDKFVDREQPFFLSQCVNFVTREELYHDQLEIARYNATLWFHGKHGLTVNRICVVLHVFV